MHKNWHILEYISSSLHPNKELLIFENQWKTQLRMWGNTNSVVTYRISS